MPLIVMDPLASPERRAEWESKVGTDSLEELHAKRREILTELNPLKALHGPFGLWDATRQQMTRAYMVKARIAIQEREEKPTEKLVEAEALADPEYAEWLDRAIADRIRYLEMENALTEVTERIQSREIEFRAWAAEARLG
jgi:hypothetical protein